MRRSPAAAGGAGTATAADGPQQGRRASVRAEPVKVFDNLLLVGTREHGAWAVVGLGRRHRHRCVV